MKYRNIVFVNGEKKELKTLPEEERKKLAEIWNRRAAAAVNYIEVGTKTA